MQNGPHAEEANANLEAQPAFMHIVARTAPAQVDVRAAPANASRKYMHTSGNASRMYAHARKSHCISEHRM